MIAEQIEQAVSEVMVWDTGTFEFAIDDLRPIDDIALYPSDVLPDADINTQMVLLEAARIFDERNRDSAQPRRARGAAAAATRRGLDPSRRCSTEAPAVTGARRGRAGGLRSPRGHPHARRRAAAPADRLRGRAVRRAVGRGPARTRWRGRSWCRSTRPASPSPASRRRSCWSTCGAAASPWRRRRRSGARRRAPRSSPWSIRARRSPGSTRRACWRPCRPTSRPWSPASRTSSRAGATWCAARRGRTPSRASPACAGSSATSARG